MLPDAEVRKCKGYPHYYVTQDGRVWSTKCGRFLSASVAAQDLPYLRVKLSGKTKYVHALVAEAWVDNPDDLPRVRHRDADTLNNHKDNLVWFSTKEIIPPKR